MTSVNKQIQHLTVFQRRLLQKALENESRPHYRQRIEIMLLADRGKSATEICQELGCAQETARYWMEMARSGLAYQWNQRAIGRPKTVNEDYINRLQELASSSPREYGYGFSRWTANWLKKHLAKELGIEIGDRHISRLLKDMGISLRQQQQPNQRQRQPISIDDLPPEPAIATFLPIILNLEF